MKDKPYRVERDEVACPCDNCIEWLVVGPDGVALGQSWVGVDGAEAAAQDKADDMNAAWDAARAACTEELEYILGNDDAATVVESARALVANWRTP